MSVLIKWWSSPAGHKAYRKRRLSRLLRVIVVLGALLCAVAYVSGCASPGSSREPIPPSYRDVSADQIGDGATANQASPDSLRR